jgi:ADP-heptose:LPS heptosyltransferase
MKPIAWSQVERLLLCRTDHIGDLVVTTPALRWFRKCLPQAHIALVVAPAARSLLEHSGWADHYWTPDQQAEIVAFGSDMAVGLSPRSATYRLLRRSGARWRAGYVYRERPLARLGCWFSLTHCWTTSLQEPLRRGLKVPHEAEVVADFVEALGLGRPEGLPEVPLAADQVAWGQQRGRGKLALHLAPRWLERGWTWPDFLQLARSLAPVLVTYGPQERSLLPAELPAVEGVEWAGDLSLPQWVALLGGCQALVSTDTGAVHLAAARGRPVLVVHLPEHQALCSQQWYPLGVDHVSLVHTAAESLISQIVEAVRPWRGEGTA